MMIMMMMIYKERNCRFCCVWGVGNWGIWPVQFFYLIQFFGEWGFCWRGFGSWRDFFSNFLGFGMDIGSLLWSQIKKDLFLLRIPLGTNISDWQTNHIVSFSCTSFWLVSLSNGLVHVCGKSIQSKRSIGAWLIKAPKSTTCWEVFLFTLNKTKMIDLVF